MTDVPTKLQRWLDLIAYLVARRLPVSGDELLRSIPAYADRWKSDSRRDQETARRMFERDKDELRVLGIPIRTVQYSTSYDDALEGYAIDRRDFYLPYLKIVQQLRNVTEYPERARPANVQVTEAEAPAALEALSRITAVPGFPLAREARSAFRKLAFDLDPDAFGGGAPVLFVDPPGSAELGERVTQLTDGLLARKRVRFRYHGIYRDAASHRDVAPYGLLFEHGQWYLIGHDATRDGLRVFRVGRMDAVQVNRASPNTHDYEIPPDFDLDEYVGRTAWELGDGEESPIIARVLFRFPLSLWAERNRHGQLESRQSDGAQVRAFSVQQVSPFLRWLLGLEGEVQVLEPAALKEELHAMARAVADHHGEHGGRGDGDA